MESNLDDVLIDNIEEKPQKKSNKRIILIAVASVVLLGVLGISSLMLAKQDLIPKNPEFSELEVELERLGSPSEELKTNKQEDDFDKLIADIKNQHSQEEKKSSATKIQDITLNKTQAIKQNEVQSKENDPVHQIDLQLDEPKITSAAPSKQEAKQKPIEKMDQKISKQNISVQKSASQIFESVEQSIPKGYYLQVGVFGGKPQQSFLNKLKNYSYKTEKIQRGEKVLTRYLIGPFPSKEIAQGKIEEITQNVNKPIVVEIR